MDITSKIYIAGHRGLVGSALVRHLREQGYENLILKSHNELDLINQNAVDQFFANERPEYVFLAAAKVGGILANAKHQADFLYENLLISANVIHAAHIHGIEKMLFLGSSCIYPRSASQPITEDALLSGPLEPTNEGYAIAKIAGLKLCEMYHRQHKRRFISAMSTNLYGPNDNFDPDNAHVIPGMMRRFHEAKTAGASSVTVWGTGEPRREFLHVDDLSEALVVLMLQYEDATPINVGTGIDCTIAELASLMATTTGFKGRVKFDTTKPDGAARKRLNTDRLNDLGWESKTTLENGLEATYRWAINNEIFAAR